MVALSKENKTISSVWETMKYKNQAIILHPVENRICEGLNNFYIEEYKSIYLEKSINVHIYVRRKIVVCR